MTATTSQNSISTLHLFLTLTAFTLGAFTIFILQRHPSSALWTSSTPILPHHTATTPQTTPRTFGTDLFFTSLASASPSNYSSRLSTPRGGFLWVKKNGTEEGKQGFWGISMFHSLHCLQMLSEQLKKTPGWESEMDMGEGEGEREHGGHSEHNHEIAHMKHCVGYIAEATSSM
jgi:hypothetical protein